MKYDISCFILTIQYSIFFTYGNGTSGEKIRIESAYRKENWGNHDTVCSKWLVQKSPPYHGDDYI
jgi:hypothetical protein